VQLNSEKECSFAVDQLSFLTANAFLSLLYHELCIASKSLDASNEVAQNLPCCGAQKKSFIAFAEEPAPPEQ
jgi:hypothetical protein